MYRILFLAIFTYTLSFGIANAQNFTASFIKSVSFNSIENHNPMLPLGERFVVSFDDLEADQKDYYYLIQHCDYNWKVSDIQTTEYMDGYNSFDILEFENSFNTYQNYTHHYFELPNRNSRIKISGNYLLTVLNSYDEICFQRRFVIYEPKVAIRAKTVRDRNLKHIDEKQVVQFSIYHPNVIINNPRQELKVVVLQNRDWNFTKTNLVPQFYKKNEIVYNYNEETSFYGNNEFLNFDTKNVQGSNISIIRTVLEDHYYNSYLFPNIARRFVPYTYFPDINGGFTIRTLNGENTATEAEYSKIHFFLEPNGIDPENDHIYIYGAYNNYACTEENKMTFNKESNYFENTLILKQGFYNYTYVTKKENKPVQLHTVEGSFQETENNYTILVYYKPFGERIGRIVGMAEINSKPF